MKTMMKSSATAALAALALALVPASLQAKVIKVPSGAILTIQQGVDAAEPGDTVIVLPGTYGGHVTIHDTKPGLKLKAAGPVKIVRTEQDGTYDKGIAISADNVRVEGFDISGFWTGIYGGAAVPHTQGGQITRNTIHDCTSEGIIVSDSIDYEIDHNTVVGNPTGISIGCDPEKALNPKHHIHHNRVSGAEGDGIRLYMAPGSTLDHNVCENNGWIGEWLGSGIFLAGSPNCTVDRNQTDNNGRAGIDVYVSLNCAVTGNEANNNAFYGIQVAGSCGSSFEHNVAQGNAQWDLADWNSPTCNTYLNNRADTAYPSLDLWDVKSSK